MDTDDLCCNFIFEYERTAFTLPGDGGLRGNDESRRSNHTSRFLGRQHHMLTMAGMFFAGAVYRFGMPLNVFIEFVVPALAVPFLILFKYGRPRVYLADLLRSFFAPRAWCALERDAELTYSYFAAQKKAI